VATRKNYPIILNQLKEKIRQARLKAVHAVNNQLLIVYWEIGNTILQQQKSEGWGTKVIDRLAVDLKMEFPDMKGWSVRNIKYMRAFAEAYPDFLIVQQPAAQLATAQKVQQLAAQIPWSHHQVILDKFKEQEQRLFYIQKIVENGWSRNILLQQIETGVHNRQGKVISNFETTLPPMQSDLVKESFKSPYVFDFLDMTEAIQERELEKALIQHLKKFMLELGSGFAYVGNQFNLVVENDDYFLDLLFYNYRLRCFVLFELKIGEFKPEYAGKLNFYINTVNEKIKLRDDKSTIGILLCKTPNKTVVKYSLQGITTPMGVAEYKTLPKEIKKELPAIETLNFELQKEIEIQKKPIQAKKDKLNNLIATKKQPTKRSKKQ